MSRGKFTLTHLQWKDHPENLKCSQTTLKLCIKKQDIVAAQKVHKDDPSLNSGRKSVYS